MPELTENEAPADAEITTPQATRIERIPKSILLWIPPDCKDCSQFDSFKTGNRLFKELECPYTNCYINSGSVWNNPAIYDAIVILGKNIHEMQLRALSQLPPRRTKNQIYIFMELDSSKAYPVCDKNYDNYFNWTMTYRLDADIPWPYFHVRTVGKELVGPNENTKWLKTQDMMPLDEEFRNRLDSKMKIAVWIDHNCYKREWVEDMAVLSTTNDSSGRIKYINELNKELIR